MDSTKVDCLVKLTITYYYLCTVNIIGDGAKQIVYIRNALNSDRSLSYDHYHL